MVNGALQAASTVALGDVMRLGDGIETIVAKIESKMETGLFNPVTYSGDIVVSGILASTYTVDNEPATSHALLMPVRKIFEWSGRDISFGMLDGGAPIAGAAGIIPSGKAVVA